MAVKKKRPGLTVFFVCLIIGAALTLWFLSKPSVAIITDPSFNEIMPVKCYTDLFINLWKQGYTLRVYSLRKTQIQDPSMTLKLLDWASDSKLVILSPVITRVVEAFEINLSSVLSESVTAKIGAKGTCVLADYCLTSDLESGWDMVPEDSTAVLYKNDNPTSTEFENDVDFMCIVDYRFTDVIPEDNLAGVICPDLSKTVLQLLENCSKQEVTADGTLYYEYREI